MDLQVNALVTNQYCWSDFLAFDDRKSIKLLWLGASGLQKGDKRRRFGSPPTSPRQIIVRLRQLETRRLHNTSPRQEGVACAEEDHDPIPRLGQLDKVGADQELR